MIGYYVHHVGRGHLHRATRLAEALDQDVTGLSSLARPTQWRGPWVQLEFDDRGLRPRDPTARGTLHWAPLGDAGLSARMHQVSEWMAAVRPSLMVCDVSVEVALLSRLHGVCVASVVLPGERGDGPHRLGRAVSDLLVAFWPSGVEGMVHGLTGSEAERMVRVGALARHPVGGPRPVPGDGSGGNVLVLGGRGGGGLAPGTLDRARALAPGWSWTVLGGSSGVWVEDTRAAILAADVVVGHAGENVVAEVAAARRPAILVPQERPHREQEFTARTLGSGQWPVLVERNPATAHWQQLLDRAHHLDTASWERWCDGRAADRFAALVDRTVATGGEP